MLIRVHYFNKCFEHYEFDDIMVDTSPCGSRYEELQYVLARCIQYVQAKTDAEFNGFEILGE